MGHLQWGWHGLLKWQLMAGFHEPVNCLNIFILGYCCSLLTFLKHLRGCWGKFLRHPLVKFVSDLKSFTELCEAWCEQTTHMPTNVCCVCVMCLLCYGLYAFWWCGSGSIRMKCVQLRKLGSLKLNHWKCNIDQFAFTVMHNWLGRAYKTAVQPVQVLQNRILKQMTFTWKDQVQTAFLCLNFSKKFDLEAINSICQSLSYVQV